jgi:hypothetical protein
MEPVGMLTLALLTLAQVPSLHAVRTASAPAIDGRLDDAAWRAAQAASAFTQRSPNERAAPAEPTRLMALYDDSALYLGVSCEQSSTPVVARLTRRDRPIESDKITIDIDTRGDGKSAFHFEVNAAGVLVDGLRFDERISDQNGDLMLEWDENWSASTTTSTGGWSAEIAIPLRVLRFEPGPRQSWGFQVRRYVSSLQEVDEWSFIPRGTAGEMLHYGRLEIEEPLEPGGGIELRPFVLGEARRRDAAEGYSAHGNDALGSIGLDLKVHLSQDMTLDATFNPDFGQVEADQVVLNLTTVELRFPEKRPFFLEGLNEFQTPVSVLYTRRIGHLPPDPTLLTLPPGVALVDAPSPVPIYGAAKLVGRPIEHLTVAALAALTGRESIEVQLPSGAYQPFAVDPLAYFQALRLKLDVGAHASVGFIGTAVVRQDPGTGYLDQGGGLALCPTGDTATLGARCHHDAYAGGFDGRWRSDSGDYVANAQVLASLIENGPDSLLPDGTVIHSGKAAAGGAARFAKEGGNWIYDLRYEGYERAFDINDAGYLERQNIHKMRGAFGYRLTEPTSLFLEQTSRIEVSYRRNFDGLLLGNGYYLNSNGQLTNFMGYWAQLFVNLARYDDREIGNGVALERAALAGEEFGIGTDPRKPVYAEIYENIMWIADGYSLDVEGRLALRFLPQLDLEILPLFTLTAGEPRFVAPGAAPGSYVFGRQRAAVVSATLRATYTFLPTLSLQAYAQAFADAVAYSDFSSYGGPKRAIALSDLVPAAAPPGQPNYQDGALNVNVVLRWEYTPGSAVFLVYTRAQLGTTTFAANSEDGPQLRAAAIAKSPATDIAMVKLSYWWGS